MSTVTLYKYRVFCVTEQAYKIVWSGQEPTTCPDNSSDTINSLLTTIIDEISTAQIKIKEENIPTGGNYQASTAAFENMTGATGASFVVDKSWPHPISALNISVEVSQDNFGDMMEVVVGPDTIIGVLTASADAGATGLNVSQTVIDNTSIGYYLELVEGVTTHNCGRVIAIDHVNNVIQPEIPPEVSFSAASPTYVRQSVFVVKDFKCGMPQKYDIGATKIGGSYVPANTIVRGIYTLNNPTESPKNFIAMIEYLY